jgi:hypothetical protein
LSLAKYENDSNAEADAELFTFNAVEMIEMEKVDKTQQPSINIAQRRLLGRKKILEKKRFVFQLNNSLLNFHCKYFGFNIQVTLKKEKDTYLLIQVRKSLKKKK